MNQGDRRHQQQRPPPQWGHGNGQQRPRSAWGNASTTASQRPQSVWTSPPSEAQADKHCLEIGRHMIASTSLLLTLVKETPNLRCLILAPRLHGHCDYDRIFQMIVATAPKSFEYLVLAGGVDDGKKAPPPIPVDRIRGLMKACLNRLAKTGLRRFDVDAWMDVDGFDVFSASMLDLIEGGRLQRIQLRLRIVNPSDSTLVSLSILAKGLRDATGTVADWEIRLYADGPINRRGLFSQEGAVRRLFEEILWVHTPSRLELPGMCPPTRVS